MKNRTASGIAAVVLALCAGCATVPGGGGWAIERPPPNTTRDPWEKVNRKIFAANEVLDRYLIKPIAQGYVKVFPPPLRDSLRHILDNLNEPLTFANCVLQGRFQAAETTGGRFLVNSTVGVAGIADIATQWKLPKQVGDFGQTLWVFGVDSGPYIIVPVMGPMTPRDGIGLGIDGYFDPMRYVFDETAYGNQISIARPVADGIDTRARNLQALDEIRKEAIDYYASFRSFYLQNRAAQLTGGQPKRTLPPANFYDEPGQ